MFTEPQWLTLLLPALFVVYLLRSTSRILNVFRVLFVILIILGLSRPVITTMSGDGTLVLLADRSSSMPGDTDRNINEIMSILKKDMPPKAGLGLVTFGATAKVSLAPSNKTFSGHMGTINAEGSNLTHGLERALSLIPTNGTGRVLMLTDGRWTGKDPRGAAAKAALRGIPLDYRYLSKDYSGDFAITGFELPSSVALNEAFLLRVEVYSPVSQGAKVSLYEAGKLLGSHRRRFEVGYNAFSFNLLGENAGVLRYRLVVEPDFEDDVVENNQAAGICEVKGRKPVLLLSQEGKSAGEKLLSGGKLEFVSMGIREVRWSLEFLAGFSAVVLDNLPADVLGTHGMQVLKGWVKHFGGGLMVLGGENAFGNGGYFRSPIEEALPVSSEVRSEHRKMPLAMMVVLDRSGSMTAPTQGGRTKMDLANLAAVGVLDFLMSEDHLGVLAVDTQPHVVVEFGRLGENKDALRKKILSIESRGGGIYVYEGILAATDRLLSSSIRAKHIILFADANDAEKPGEYWELLDKATKAGITLSAIGLGTEMDSDAEILKKVAAAGKGRIFFARDPEDLPRLFLQDVFVAAKSSYVEEYTEIGLNEAHRHLFPSLQLNRGKFGVDAYNFTYLKSGGLQLASTLEEEKAPILSHWQFGLGGVVCLGTELKEGLLQNKSLVSLLTALIEQLSLDDSLNLENGVITQGINNGYWQVRVSLDPERTRDFLRDEPKVKVLRLLGNGAQKADELELEWETADSLVAGLQLEGSEVVASMLNFNRLTKRLPPVCQPYSPEYRRGFAQEGLSELKDMAQITGGGEIFNLSNLWKNIPVKLQKTDLSGLLILFGVFVFFLELIERRLSMVTMAILYLQQRKKKRKLSLKPMGKRAFAKVLEDKQKTAGVYDPAAKSKSQAPATASKNAKEKEGSEPQSMSSLLKRAKDNAEKRL